MAGFLAAADNLSDDRTDFGAFVMAKGLEFEGKVLDFLRGRYPVVTIAQDRSASRSEAAVRGTWEAMAAGSKIIAQAPIWNPQDQTFGVIDLAVRSDVLEELFPDTLSPKEVAVAAPAIPRAAWHYRVVDIKFSTIHLLKNGHVSSDHLGYAVQVFTYNAALGRLQGFTLPSAYLLGRGWKQGDERGYSAFERLGRVDQGYATKDGDTLSDLARKGCAWIRKLRAEGGRWEVLPTPSVPELWPNMRSMEDAGWAGAKKRIAAELEDLTLIPRVNPSRRLDAHAAGLRRWTDPSCSAARLGITTPRLLGASGGGDQRQPVARERSCRLPESADGQRESLAREGGRRVLRRLRNHERPQRRLFLLPTPWRPAADLHGRLRPLHAVGCLGLPRIHRRPPPRSRRGPAAARLGGTHVDGLQEARDVDGESKDLPLVASGGQHAAERLQLGGGPTRAAGVERVALDRSPGQRSEGPAHRRARGLRLRVKGDHQGDAQARTDSDGLG